MFRTSFVTDTTLHYVLRGVLNELAVSGTSSPVSIASGCAWVYGAWYQNDASTTLAIPTPATNPRIDRVVLQFGSVAQTVRIARVAGTEAASPTAPALTQTATTYQVSLAQVRITTGGVITVTDERGYVTDPGAAGAVDGSTLAYNTGTKKIGIPTTATPTIAGLTTTAASGGGNVQNLISNTSNTASSNARVYLSVAGASANDAFTVYDISGVQDWAVGSDNSDSDKFKVSAGATLGTNDAMAIDTSLNTTFGGNVTASASNSGANVTVNSTNSSNTASSNARLVASVGGSSAGDPFTMYDIAGVQDWAVGIDNSDSDKFKISASNALGTSDELVIDTSGNATLTGALTTTGVTSSGAIGGTNITASGTLAGAAASISGNTSSVASSSGGTVQVLAQNSSNTANSNARLAASVAGGSAGDASIYYEVSGVQAWAEGIDNSDSDKYKIAASGTLGTNDVLTLTTAGAATLSGSLTVANGLTVSAGTIAMATVPILANRQGGSASDWATTGTSSQTPTNSKKVVGAVSIAFSGSVTYANVISTTVVTLPITYTGTPIVILTMGPTSASNIAGQYFVTVSAVSTTTFSIALWSMQTTTAGASSVTVYWETTGPV